MTVKDPGSDVARPCTPLCLGSTEDVLLIRMYKYVGEKLKVRVSDTPSIVHVPKSQHSAQIAENLVVRVSRGFPLLSSGHTKETASLYNLLGSIRIQGGSAITPASSTVRLSSTTMDITRVSHPYL